MIVRVMTVMGAIYSCLGVLGEVLPKLGEEVSVSACVKGLSLDKSA